MIEEKTVYVTRGKQFDSLEKAQAFRFDLVGSFLDKLPGDRLSAKDRLRLAEFLTENRAQLQDLLDY